MQTKATFKFFSAVLMTLMMTACGGGDGSALDNTINGGISSSNTSSSTSAGTNSSASSSVDTTSPKKIGKGNGESFVEGQIGVNKEGLLSAGGTAILTVTIVSSTNNLVTTPIDITFNSTCISAGQAILKVGTEVVNKVTATNGSATIAYTANGCVGKDDVFASASIDNKVVNAGISLTVQSDAVQSMKFVDASPNQISLAGVGGNETSLVRFQVLGSTGAPISNIDVDFALSTAVGGLTLTTATSKTDGAGYASTIVQAGSIHTAVRVTATAKVTGIFTTSSQLIVSTGIPDQDSISLAATDGHPIGWDYEGVKSTFTVRLADAFNNPPPLGTSVAFTTEGGSIASGCATDAVGACSVDWFSQNPKPTRNSNVNTQERKLCVDSFGVRVSDYAACSLERAGRVTVLATAIGNESFIDANGNGIYDTGDVFKKASDLGNCSPNTPELSAETPANSSTIPCDDLSEAYLDKNENGVHDSDEEFVDFTSTGAEGVPDHAYTSGNGIYNGVLCTSKSNAPCTSSQVTIRQDFTLIMTSSQVLMRQNSLPFIDTHLSLGISPASTSTKFWLADENGNGVGPKTTLNIDAGNLKDGSAAITAKGPLAPSNDPISVGVTVSATSTTTPPSGSFNIEIKTPLPFGGDITVIQTVSVN